MAKNNENWTKDNWQYSSDMDHDTLLNMLLLTMRARGARVTYTFRAVDEDGDGRINFTGTQQEQEQELQYCTHD